MKTCKYYMAHICFETLYIADLFGLEWILILIGIALLLIYSILRKIADLRVSEDTQRQFYKKSAYFGGIRVLPHIRVSGIKIKS